MDHDHTKNGGSSSTGSSNNHHDQTEHPVGKRIWNHLISEDNEQGPIAVGAREYETLRIQAGQAALGKEVTKDVKTSPLEIHWQRETICLDKGCYQGQEGIASLVKNPRGPPRILYAVLFDDDFNVYESQSRGDDGKIENLTRMPQVGDTLYVLGSNEGIQVGILTSVGEPGGTGDPTTVALALVRRADSILKQMKDMEIDISRNMDDVIDITESSGMIEPPPLDPLDGLEVVVGGSFTVGKLQMVPSRRYRKGRNMFDENLKLEVDFDFDDVAPRPDASLAERRLSEEEELKQAVEEAAKAQAAAEAAAREAKRKAEKMELLRKRAEEAMERKKQKKAD